MSLKMDNCEDCQRMRVYYYMFLLVEAIKGLSFKFDVHNHPPHALHEAKRDF